jgi:drug/metabolite transporter (DMT)-like permease
MNTEMLAVTFGLSSAIAWGAGDFSGGFAAKRGHVYTVILYAELIGAGFLVLPAIWFAEKMPHFYQLSIGGLAGIFGVLGLAAFYKGLAQGRMAIVAPISAVVTAIVPVGFSFFNEGLPGTPQLFGFAVAFVSVWFLSHAAHDSRIQARELYLPILAGLGFGMYLILISRVIGEAILWPLIGSRVAAMAVMGLLILVSKDSGLPGRGQLPYIALAGIFDAAGTAFFALATHLGRLDISAVIGSLYPAATVLLAWVLLKERLGRQQWIGVMTGLAALILIAS